MDRTKGFQINQCIKYRGNLSSGPPSGKGWPQCSRQSKLTYLVKGCRWGQSTPLLRGGVHSGRHSSLYRGSAELSSPAGCVETCTSPPGRHAHSCRSARQCTQPLPLSQYNEAQQICLMESLQLGGGARCLNQTQNLLSTYQADSIQMI